MTDILAFITVISISFAVGICITKLFIVTHDDYDEEQDELDISGREGDGRARNKPEQFEPFGYYRYTRLERKLRPKQKIIIRKRTKWEDDFDFN